MNVYVNAFAFKENYGASMQLEKKSDSEKTDIYLKNIIVSLVSAKRQNPQDEVLLVANMEVKPEYQAILDREQVRIRVVPFDKYEMPKDFPWALAFYKLKVLDYLARECDYERILLADTDTVTMGSFADIWQEVDYGLMLYPVNHAFSHEHRDAIREDYRKLFPGENRNIIHYGGEFVCGRKEALQEFMSYCDLVYDKIKARDFSMMKNAGDEAILAMAAALYREKALLYEAGSYIFRYWTDEKYYLIATNTVNNPVTIWHLPSEKDRGMLVMYDYFMKNNTFPDREKAAEMFGIVKAKRPMNVDTIKGRLQRKKTYLRSKKK